MNCSNCGKEIVGSYWGDRNNGGAFCSSNCYVAGGRTPTESDPHGLPADAPGAKLDAGKTRVDLVFDGFARALLAVSAVSTYGAAKYSEGGWRHVPDGIKRYRAAAGRHRLHRATDGIDPESGLMHLAHEAWNVLAELELTLIQQDGGSDAQ